MVYGKDDEAISLIFVINAVGKPFKRSTANRLLDDWKTPRVLTNEVQTLAHSAKEGLAHAGPLSLIPDKRFS